MNSSTTFFTEPQENLFKIHFEEEDYDIYMPKEAATKVEIIKMSLLHSMQEAQTKEIKLKNINADVFIALYKFIEGELIYDCLDQELKKEPWIYEIILDQLSFLYPSYPHKMSKLALAQLKLMTIKEAEQLFNNPVQELTFAKVLAYKKITASLYFSSQKAQENYDAKLRENLKKYADVWKVLKGDLNSEERILYLAEKCKIKSELRKQEEDLAGLKKSPMGLQNAAKYLNHPNPLIKKEALKACRKLEQYKAKIKEVLIESGANLKREDLLEYLIGPQAFLFSYYGIVPLSQANDLTKPFRYVPILQNTCVTEKRPHYTECCPISIHLNDESPIKLESELRAILGKRYQDLPEPLFAEEPPVKQVEDQNLTPIDFQEVFEVDAIDLWLKEYDKNKKLTSSMYFKNKEEGETWLKNHPERKDFKKYKLSPWAYHYASQHIYSENPIAQIKAQRAKTQLSLYKKCIQQTLEKNQAHIFRKDLLDHVIGPKNYLFAYYGIVPLNQERQKTYPFGFIPGSMNTLTSRQGRHLTPLNFTCGYHLSNLSPKALETEIRSDITYLRDRTTSFLFEELPPQLINNEEITLPISPQLKALHEKFHPLLHKEGKMSVEEEQTLIQELIIYNNWEQYGIQANRIVLQPFTSKNGIYTVKGHLYYRGGTCELYFNTYDFNLIIDRRNQINPDIISTHNNLKLIFS